MFPLYTLYNVFVYVYVCVYIYILLSIYTCISASVMHITKWLCFFSQVRPSSTAAMQLSRAHHGYQAAMALIR